TAAGSYALTAGAGALPPATSNAFTIDPDAATQLGFLIEPANDSAGTALPDFEVAIEDQFGNVVGGSGTTFVTLQASQGPAVLGAMATAQPGIAVFTGVVPIIAGTYAFMATAAGLNPATSTPFTVTAGAAQQLAFVAGPANTVAGLAVPDFQVIVEDRYGNPTSGSGAVVKLVVTSGPGQPSAGPVSATAAGGVATFSGLTFATAGAYTLSAGANGLASAQSAPFVVSAGAATGLAFDLAPAAGTAGQ